MIDSLKHGFVPSGNGKGRIVLKIGTIGMREYASDEHDVQIRLDILNCVSTADTICWLS